jgi:hypothetical protein
LDGNEDEIAGDVAASDALAVDEAILEADMSLCLTPLSSDQANVRCILIAKVISNRVCLTSCCSDPFLII